jgi:hypothetical protein
MALSLYLAWFHLSICLSEEREHESLFLQDKQGKKETRLSLFHSFSPFVMIFKNHTFLFSVKIFPLWLYHSFKNCYILAITSNNTNAILESCQSHTFMNVIRRHWLIYNGHTPYILCCWSTKKVVVSNNSREVGDALIVLCSVTYFLTCLSKQWKYDLLFKYNKRRSCLSFLSLFLSLTLI